ncbi:hypothetical protein [Streptomyces sp. NBC_01373]|uniref:hypothetical protein n=1 Tax=Streptomyces sp. NBC_01373 TaxID=2903843 RepID=UPI002251B0D8|nr:hypothetical protein [Streptomyces sp. NBC_01373]MCX4704438.1 hypothetical protein [Streptomyces sp. NBC_01373]
MAKWWGANLVWDGAFYRVQRDGYEICFVRDFGVALDEIDDVDMWVVFHDGERWSGTIAAHPAFRTAVSGKSPYEDAAVELIP